MSTEIYYRRRSKKVHQPSMEMEQCHQNVVVQGGVTATDSPVSRPLQHVPPPPACTLLLQESHLLFSDNDGGKFRMENCIKPGFLYEIDHSYLPPRTPVQLRSIRVALVCEKTEVSVAISYPSMESLKAFFNYSTRRTHPALDERFVMASALANKVLIRLIPEDILADQKRLVAFWVIDSSPSNVGVREKKGSYLCEALKGNGMVRWGMRRQVKYLGRHTEADGVGQNSSSSFVSGAEGSQMELGAGFDEKEQSMEEKKEGGVTGDVGEGGQDEDMEEKDEREEEDDEREEEEEEEEEEDDDEEDDDDDGRKIKGKGNKNLKRKRYPFRNLSVKKSKKEKVDIKRKQKQTQKKKKKKSKMGSKEALIQRDPKDRWSAERYKLAERNLWEVMKSKGARAENPILRPQLRAEARKRIGDTGLLDHLLKHMAGKLAPGGGDRFRRRHNPDGAMEYWLESADLVNIRKEAGVADPYWVPPPGWKPGDSPTQDPVCARELMLLKEDISNIKRELELMATKMQLEEEVARLRREVDEISSKKREEGNEGMKIGANNGCDIGQKLDLLVTSLKASKCDQFGDASVSVEKYKEQLMAISEFVKEIEEKMGKVTTPKVVGKARGAEGGSLMEVADKVEEREAKSSSKVQALIAEERETKLESAAGKEEEEGKAAKIKRLKSGFRICKPQGTFLWPNMVKDNSSSSSSMTSSAPQVFVQVEVPTPPSVSSSTTTAPQLFHLYQPVVVKPLAEKRAVTVTVSTLSKPQDFEPKNYSTTAPLVDLNDAPPNLNAMPMQESNVTRGWDGHGGRGYDEMNACCCSSSPPPEVGSWLALSSTLRSGSDDSSHG